jgi:hypothetical protein
MPCGNDLRLLKEVLLLPYTLFTSQTITYFMLMVRLEVQITTTNVDSTVPAGATTGTVSVPTMRMQNQ